MRRRGEARPNTHPTPCFWPAACFREALEGDTTSFCMRLCVYVREKYNFLYDVKELSLTLTEEHGLERTRNEELPVLLAECH
jgi:hypothetical protein